MFEFAPGTTWAKLVSTYVFMTEAEAIQYLDI